MKKFLIVLEVICMLIFSVCFALLLGLVGNSDLGLEVDHSTILKTFVVMTVSVISANVCRALRGGKDE